MRTKEQERERFRLFYHANKARLKDDRNRRSREWYWKNKMRARENNKQWRHKNKDYVSDYSKRYASENRTRLKPIRDRWIKNNRHRVRELDNKRAKTEKRREWVKRWREKNKERRKAEWNMWVKANPHRVSLSRKRYYDKAKQSPEFKRKRLAYELKYYRENIRYNIAVRMRHRVRLALKNHRKSNKTFVLVGCSPSALCTHLESLFKPGMTWENKNLWHIDHKRPCSSFDLAIESEQLKCFHYTNLQPLWWWENLAKHNKIAA